MSIVYAGFVARIVTGVVLLAAATAKGGRLPQFGRTLRALGFPDRSTRVLAWLAIVSEVVVGLGLVAGAPPRATALACLFLFGLFAAVSAAAIFRSRAVPCNCFGEATTLLGARTLVLNAIIDRDCVT